MMANQYERLLLGIILQDYDPVVRSNGYSGSTKDMSKSEVFLPLNCITLNCVSNILINHCSAISRGFYSMMPREIMTGSGLNFTLLFV